MVLLQIKIITQTSIETIRNWRYKVGMVVKKRYQTSSINMKSGSDNLNVDVELDVSLY